MKKIKVLSITVLLAVLSTYNTFAQNQLRYEAFIRGMSSYVAGKVDAAISIFKALTEKYPSDDASWYYMALCHLQKDEVDAARACLNKAVAIDSTNYWYRDALVSTYVPGREDVDVIIAQYEKLRRDFPEKKEQQYVLVRLYYAAGNFAEALSALDEIEENDGKSDASVITRFRILSDMEDKKEEAYEVLKSYVAEYSSPYVLSLLGDHEMGMYNDEAARAYYDEALMLEADYLPAKLGKAETFRLTRKYSEYFDILKDVASDANVTAAMKSEYLMNLLRGTDPRFASTFKPQLDSVMALSLKASPADTTILQTAGAYYLYVGETDKAVDSFKKVRDVAPGSDKAHAAYIQVLARGEDWHALEEACREAKEAFPEETYFLQADNLAKYNLKDYKGVLENSEKMLSLAGKDTLKRVEALSSIGDMQIRLGQDNAAYKTYDKALKIKPDYALVLNNYAWNLCLKGRRLKQALKMSRKAVEIEPKNVSYLDTYGWILHLTGNDLEAKLFFKQAMIYGGKTNATVMAHYVVVLEALGEKDLADLYREQLKKLPPEDE